MKKYLYNYQTIVTFSNPICDHQILLRCQPAANDFQSPTDEHLILPPEFRIKKSADAFGNRIIYGGTRDEHSVLAYVCAGIVQCKEYKIQSELMRPFYGLDTPLTHPTKEMEELLPLTGGSIETQAADICHNIHEAICYEPFSTDVTTSAAEALRQRKGVCQDMAHLMIALCRMKGITARYANGFVEGIGATHAWAEVAIPHDKGNVWIGIDPTHDRIIDYGYIKLAHGRDANDCTVNRGTYLGNSIQQTTINVTLQEI